MSMRVEQVTSPGGQPVSLDEVKRQIGLLDNNHDVLLSQFIDSTVAWVERHLQSRLITQAVRFIGEDFGPLPIYPIQSIDSVVYDDADGVEQTLSGSEYYTSLTGFNPVIKPVDGWPALKDGKPGSVRIEATVGYGVASDVPADIKAAMLIRIKEMFANRGESVPGSSGMVGLSPVTIDALLSPYRRHSV